MPIYQEIWAGPARWYRRGPDGKPVLSSKKYITIHATANDASAEGEASWATRRPDGTSSHYYGDNDSIKQSLDTDWCANHVGSAEGNVYGISWEITGVNDWTRAQWLANVAWDLLARQIAIDCREHGISVRLLTIIEMRMGFTSGFITHDMARRAWGDTTHTDPGPNFPMDHLMTLVREHLGEEAEELNETEKRELHNIHEMMFWNMRPWSEETTHKAREILALVEGIAARGGIGPEDLAELKAAADAGARAGISATLTADTIADAIPDDLAAEVVELLGRKLVVK